MTNSKLEENVERFKKSYETYGDNLLEKIIEIYESNSYIDRQYKLGQEPENALYYLAYEYAMKYGKPFFSEKLKNNNPFLGEMYSIGSNYVVQVMHGQGSVYDMWEKSVTDRENDINWDFVRRVCKEFTPYIIKINNREMLNTHNMRRDLSLLNQNYAGYYSQTEVDIIINTWDDWSNDYNSLYKDSYSSLSEYVESEQNSI